MWPNLQDHLKTESVLGKGVLRHIRDLDALSFPKSVPASSTKGLLPPTPSGMSSDRSRQTSSDLTSEAAPEIVVWTEDMDMDSPSQSESDDSSALQASVE